MSLQMRDNGRNNFTATLGWSLAIHSLIAACLLIGGTGYMPPPLARPFSQVITISMVASTQMSSEAGGKRSFSLEKKPFAEKRAAHSSEEMPAEKVEKKSVAAEADILKGEAAVNITSLASGMHDATARAGTEAGTNKSNDAGHNTIPLSTGSEDTGNAAGQIADHASSRPAYKANDQPSYPFIARLRGHEGTVLLSLEVLPNGRVGRIKVKASSGYEVLDQSALSALKKWIFEPARQKGTPIAFWVDVPVRFSLHPRGTN